MKFCFNFYLGHLSKYPNKTSAQQTAAIDSEYKWMPACKAGCKMHTLHGLPVFVSPSGRVSTSACSSAMKPLSSNDFSLYSTEGPADQAANQAAVPPPAVAYYSYSDYGDSQSEEEPAEEMMFENAYAD